MYGICKLSIVSLRAEPSDRSEMVTQLLFGECYKVIDEISHPKWIKIETHLDEYPGWIDRFQHFELTESSYKKIIENSRFVSETIGLVHTESGDIVLIVAGSRLPFLGEGTNFDRIFEINDEEWVCEPTVINTSTRSHFYRIKDIAVKYLNSPYLWGGRTHFGIDCSGFTQQVFTISGYTLKRDSSQQAEQGKEIEYENRKPGDLAFFQSENGKIIHVGIVMENDEIIHASSKVRIDKLDTKGIWCIERSGYSHTFHSLRRIIE